MNWRRLESSGKDETRRGKLSRRLNRASRSAADLERRERERERERGGGGEREEESTFFPGFLHKSKFGIRHASAGIRPP